MAASPEHVGQAAGLFQTARSLGCIAASVVVGLAFSGGTGAADWVLLASITAGLAFAMLVVGVLWRVGRAPAPPSSHAPTGA